VIPSAVELGDGDAFFGGCLQEGLDARRGHVPHLRLGHAKRLTRGITRKLAQPLIFGASGRRQVGKGEPGAASRVAGPSPIRGKKFREKKGDYDEGNRHKRIRAP
jgi:hypothetical protein